MPEWPEFRDSQENLPSKLPTKQGGLEKVRLLCKPVVYFWGIHSNVKVTQHLVTWTYWVWIDRWYRVECLEVGDFPQLKCQDVFVVFLLHVIYICWLSAFEWHTHTHSPSTCHELHELHHFSLGKTMFMAISVGDVGTSSWVPWGDFKDDRVYCKERTVWWYKVVFFITYLRYMDVEWCW